MVVKSNGPVLDLPFLELSSSLMQLFIEELTARIRGLLSSIANIPIKGLARPSRSPRN